MVLSVLVVMSSMSFALAYDFEYDLDTVTFANHEEVIPCHCGGFMSYQILYTIFNDGSYPGLPLGIVEVWGWKCSTCGYGG